MVEIQGAVREAMFNLVPHDDEAGLTGFYVLGANTALFVVLHARTGSDYGLDATTSPIYQFFPITTTEVHLWGVPADPSHDANRFPVGTTEGISSCKPYPEGCYGPVKSSFAAGPISPEPDHLRRAADGKPLDRVLLRGGGRGRGRLARDHGLRSAHLQPEPHGDADDGMPETACPGST